MLKGAILGCLWLGSARPLLAQTPFVDVAVMADRDPTEFFSGSDSGWAGRAALGVQGPGRHGFRFEVDVPKWRIDASSNSSPIYCAEAAHCVGGVGLVPARSFASTAVRTVSYTGLYAFNMAADPRVTLSLVAGGGVEQREYRSSGWWDELNPAGVVVAHHEFDRDSPKLWAAMVFGADVEIRLTRHLALAPQLRVHTFPYPAVSIVRPGVSVRWRFR